MLCSFLAQSMNESRRIDYKNKSEKKMTDYTFSPELDERLRGFISKPGNFIADIGFVHALFAYPLVAVREQFIVPIEDKSVIPVFTTSQAVATFQEQVTQALTYVNKSFVSVVEDLMTQEFDAIAFNLQPAGQDASNATMLPREHLITFINRYTDVLNKLSDNPSLSVSEQHFLMPAFTRQTADGSVSRIFATLSNADGESFVPVFSNILSFSKWYNHPDFGIPFQESKGIVLTWCLSELKAPRTGVNELEDVLGVAVDPFDASDYAQSIILWQDLESSGTSS